MNSSLASEEEEPVGGMSDAEEIKRWQNYTQHSQGLGESSEEVFVDFEDDLEELGLRDESI